MFPATSLPKAGKTCRIAAIAAVVLTLGVTGVASAGNQPILKSTYPISDGHVRSIDATVLMATYDRELSGLTDAFYLHDVADNDVAGDEYKCGPGDDVTGRKSICFRPTNPLTETASPYHTDVYVHGRLGTDETHSSWTFWIDDTAPLAPVVSSPLNLQVRTDQPLVVSGTAEPGARMIVVEDAATIAQDYANSGGIFTIVLPYPPEDGVSHTFEVFAIDEAGNVSPGSGTITIWHDSVVQLPVITFPAEGQQLNTGSITVKGTAKAGSTVTVREASVPIGTATTDAGGLWQVPIGFAAGSHTIDATAFDGVMTDGPSAARTFVVDLTAPVAPVILTPASGATLNASNVAVSGTAEPNTTVRVKEGVLLRATAPVNGAGGWTATIAFVDGPHTITATAVDGAGNVGPAASRSFTVDTAVPAVPVILTPPQGQFLNTSLVTVSGNAEPNATMQIKRGTVVIGTTTANGSGGWTVGITFADGAHSITAVAIDAGGNPSAESDVRGFNVDTIAPPAPAITKPGAGDTVASNTVTVEGTAEQSANIEVFEGVTSIGTSAADGESNWSVPIAFANGPHTIRARATDLAGNVSPYSALRSFTVTTIADVTPPVVPVLVDPPSGSTQQPFVVFRGTAEAGSTVKIYEGAGVIASGTAVGGSFEFGTAMLGGVHTVTATATDPSGNESLPTAGRTFTVDGARPTVAFSTPDNRIYLPAEPVFLDGSATDNVGVAAVELEFRNLDGSPGPPGIFASCTGCPGSSVLWDATPALGPGAYDVIARSIDLAGNRSAPVTISIYVL